MTKEEAVQFLYQIADEIQSLLDKRPSPKGQWTSQKRLEALCLGSNGHCQECNEWHRLFRRDWQRTYWRRKF